MDPHAVAASQPTLAQRLRALREQRRSCVLRVTNGKLDGEVCVTNGEIIAATFGKMRGPLAVHALLATGDAIAHEVLTEDANEQADEEEDKTSDARPSMIVPRASHDELTRAAPDASVVVPLLLPTWAAPVQEEPSPAEQPRSESTLPESRLLETPAPPSAPAGSEALVASEFADPPLLDRSAEAEPAAQPAYTAERPDQLALYEQGAETFGATDFLPAPARSKRSRGLFTRERLPMIALTTVLYAGLMIAVLFWRSQPQRVAPKSGGTQVTSSSVDRLVKLEEGKAPEAPSGALVPTIVLRLLVGADGQVKQADVQSRREGLAALEKQAIAAVRTYRFRPALQAGKPVEAWITLPVRFAPTPVPRREIAVKGSDTIGAALMPAWAEALHGTQPQLNVQIEALGSSTGFAGLLNGSAALAASSRLIRADELAFAERLGIQLREVIAGYDGIAVIVHPNNSMHSLDVETVARIFAQRITNWAELGGTNAAIHVFGRPSYSGTHGFFKERVLARLGPDASFGPSVTNVETTKEIIDAVLNDVDAIGYASLGQVTSSVRALALAPLPGAPAVPPAAPAIRDGSYPVARPLLLYLRADSGHDPRALVDLALSREGQALVEKNGFVPLLVDVASELVAETAAPVVPSPEVIRIYFNPNSAAIAQNSKLDLLAAAVALRARRSLLVVGNADSSGKLESNRRLARQRADVVAARLQPFASRDASIAIDVAATDHPLATNNTSAGRSTNRRVDVIVLGR
jgi:phosphate transport system substrate-binding protein